MASGFLRERSQSCPEARHVNLYRARGVAALVIPIAPAKLGNAVPAAEPGERDAALPLRRRLLPRRPPDLLRDLLGRRILRHGVLGSFPILGGYAEPDTLRCSARAGGKGQDAAPALCLTSPPPATAKRLYRFAWRRPIAQAVTPTACWPCAKRCRRRRAH